MLQPSPGLSPVALAAIAELEARTVAVDGGRLKLEYGTLRTRDPDVVNDLLWWDGERLLGFLGLYSFGSGPAVELAGMVDPTARRRGIGTALVDAALARVRDRQWTTTLLVVPRNDAGGGEFAGGRGGILDHSEHAMLLAREPADAPPNPRVTLRDAGPADREARQQILADGFGWAPDDDAPRGGNRAIMIDFDGAPVGYLRTSLEDDTAGIYGFAVAADRRGQGIGRDVLRRVCRDLFAAGVSGVRLEVEVNNEHALGLYTSVGFSRMLTEDYYALPSN